LAQSDTLCFTIDQAKQLLKDAETGLACDSLIENRALKIVELYSIISAKDEQIRLGGDVIQRQANQLKKSKKKIKNLTFIGWALGGVAAIEAVFLLTILF